MFWFSDGIKETPPRGARSIVPVTFYFKGYKPLRFELQCKFYELEDDEHYFLGTKLNKIALKCYVARGDFESTVEGITFEPKSLTL